MEQTIEEQDVHTSLSGTGTPAGLVVAAQAGTGGCGCGTGAIAAQERETPYSFVFALGNISWHFPSVSVEKEFMQANAGLPSSGQTEAERIHAALTRPQNRYLTRQLCWVLTISNIETYILQPFDAAGFDQFVDAIRPPDDPNDRRIDLVVGVRGPIAGPERCNGLMLPIVRVDQLYSFTQRELIQSIPRPAKVADKEAKQFERTAIDLFANRIMQFTDNAGASDEHRALNYLAVRVPQIYALAVQRQEANSTLDRIEVQPSRMNEAGARKLVNVIFVFRDRATSVEEKYRVRVDVTEEFPFLDLPMSPYYDR